MRRSRKFMLIALLAVVVLAGSIGGVVYAQTESGTDNQTKAQALLDRVCEIYQQNTGVAIDSQKLKDAFTQAQGEIRDKAKDDYLQGMVDKGKINQDQADAYKAWLESKPDVPLMPGMPGLKGPGMSRGFGGFGGGFRCPCPPQATQ